MRRSATRNFLHSGNFASRVVINVVEHISSLPAVMAVRSRTHTFSPAGILKQRRREADSQLEESVEVRTWGFGYDNPLKFPQLMTRLPSLT